MRSCCLGAGLGRPTALSAYSTGQAISRQSIRWPDQAGESCAKVALHKRRIHRGRPCLQPHRLTIESARHPATSWKTLALACSAHSPPPPTGQGPEVARMETGGLSISRSLLLMVGRPLERRWFSGQGREGALARCYFRYRSSKTGMDSSQLWWPANCP